MTEPNRPVPAAARLRIVSSNDAPAPKTAPPLPAKRRLYVPRIDVDVLAPVVRLPGSALAVFLAIRFEVAVTKSRSVGLGNRLLRERWRVGSDAKHRGLQALQKAGLIKVEQRPGCSPLVTLLGN